MRIIRHTVNLARPITTSTSPRSLLHPPTSTRTMSSKLIFAPGEAPPDAHQPSSDTPHARAAQFNVGTLSRSALAADPFTQFHAWFSDPALKGHVPETVTLSTAELPSGKVSSRMVYLKELDERGWVIYSNWGTSRKAHDVQTNPYASLCFWWKPLERQVRIEGRAHRITTSESQAYFDTRARGSRIGAWASQQSSVLHPTTTTSHDDDGSDDGRAELESQVQAVESRFAGRDQIPVPSFWGGLRVEPETVEFWQGRDSRLHDRFRYTRVDGGGGEDGTDEVEKGRGRWKIERLSP